MTPSTDSKSTLRVTRKAICNTCNESTNMSESEQLEREAIALVKQYAWVLPAPAKAFFKRLAKHLNWANLEGIL